MLTLLIACGPKKSPAHTLAQSAQGSDSAELLASAQALPGAELRWSRACVRAGARKPCEDFADGDAKLLAFLALAFGEPERAQRLVQDTTQPAPTRRDLSLGIARHARRDDAVKAKAALTLAESLDPKNERLADRKLVAASLAVTERDFVGATALMRELIGSDIAMSADQRDELIRIGTLSAERAADTQRDVTDQVRKLFSEMNKISPDEAVGEAEQLVQRQPNSSLAYLALGFARLKSSDEPGAVNAWEKARTLCTFDPEPDFQLAKLHERRQRYARAVFYLDRGMQVSPVWPKGLWLMVDMALQAREPQQATKALKTLKRLYPEDVMVDLGLAKASLDRDEGVRALGILKEAVREHPSDLRPAMAMARTAMTLHARAQSPSERERLAGEAESALKSAELVAKDSDEVQALRNAVEKLRNP